MEKIPKEDIEFFFRLESLNNALTLSVTDPIVITDYIPIGDSVGELGTFWDCWENENEARNIMRGRIEMAPKDIDAHIQSHRRMLERFYSVQEAMNVHDRPRARNTVEELGTLARLHGNLVRAHKSRYQDRSFLEYPRAQRGILFTLPFQVSASGGSFANLEFNRNNALRNLSRDLVLLEKSAHEFSSQRRKIAPYRIGEHDLGEGFADCSYRGRLALTEELLRRVNE